MNRLNKFTITHFDKQRLHSQMTSTIEIVCILGYFIYFPSYMSQSLGTLRKTIIFFKASKILLGILSLQFIKINQ